MKAPRWTPALREFNRLAKELISDHIEAMLWLKGVASPFSRRTYVRTVFTFIEGVTFGMKQLTLGLHASGRVALSAAELAALREEMYDLEDSGTPTVRPKFTPLAKGLRLACSAFAKAIGSDHQVNTNDVGWSSFKQAVTIRNRIVHPKGRAEFELSETDMRTVEAGRSWFFKQTGPLLGRAAALRVRRGRRGT